MHPVETGSCEALEYPEGFAQYPGTLELCCSWTGKLELNEITGTEAEGAGTRIAGAGTNPAKGTLNVPKRMSDRDRHSGVADGSHCGFFEDGGTASHLHSTFEEMHIGSPWPEELR